MTLTSVTAVNASIDSNKKVTVTGAISSKNRQLVTVRITDPKGNPEYINNTVSSMTGNFTFSFTMANTFKGRYDVAIGGTGIASHADAYFYYGPDADLNNLSISSGAFDQAFATGTPSYSASVVYNVNSVTVTPILSDTKASASVNSVSVLSGQASDPINLNVGSNTINVVVTAQDGITTKTYMITIYKAKPPSTPSTPPTPPMSDDATLKSLVINDEDISIDSETATYNVTVGSGADWVMVTPTVNEAHAAVTVNGATVGNGTSESLPIGDLMESQNGEIDIVVTAQDGTEKTYKIIVSKELTPPMSGDATLKSLVINDEDISIDSETATYNVTVGSGADWVMVTPTANEAHAAVTVNGATVGSGTSESLPIGDLMESQNGEIDIVVTAQDGTEKTYKIIIIW
jgi:hypothetical protein